jgi:hypothetical protein
MTDKLRVGLDWTNVPEQEIPFTVNQNGNYRRGWQRYVRGGMPKGSERIFLKVEEYGKHCTLPRGWVLESLEEHDTEFQMLVGESNGKRVFVHIPKNDTIETTFEWDYEG